MIFLRVTIKKPDAYLVLKQAMVVEPKMSP